MVALKGIIHLLHQIPDDSTRGEGKAVPQAVLRSSAPVRHRPAGSVLPQERSLPPLLVRHLQHLRWRDRAAGYVRPVEKTSFQFPCIHGNCQKWRFNPRLYDFEQLSYPSTLSKARGCLSPSSFPRNMTSSITCRLLPSPDVLTRPRLFEGKCVGLQQW